MSNAARPFGRITLVAFAVLAPALLLAGCGNSTEEQLAEQVAAAKQAAERAEAAQRAAEKASRAIIAQAPPGTFGTDESVTENVEFAEDESVDSTDDVGVSDDSGGGESTLPVPN